MIVTDASVIVHGLEREGPSRLLLMDGDIHVPHLADLEVAQALRAQVSRGSVSASAAEARLARWRTLGISRYPAVGLLARVWTLRENLSAYDASYVALAEALECPLATADRRLASAPGPSCEMVLVGP